MKKGLSKKSRLIVFCIVVILALGVFSPVAMAAVKPEAVFCQNCQVNFNRNCPSCYCHDGKVYCQRVSERQCYNDATGQYYYESCGCTYSYFETVQNC